jgi:predicted GIY-YIG superfamily endonuclease
MELKIIKNMAKDNETVKKEIEAFKSENGGNYDDYYIGITNNISRRIYEDVLILDHISNGWLTVNNEVYNAECESRDHAVEVELHFQDLGMYKKNASAKGTTDSKYIYCFKLDENNKNMILLKEEYGADTEMRVQIKKNKELTDSKEN